MPKRVDRIVFFQRHTPLVGTTPMYTPPMDVGAYVGGVLTAWQGTGLGGGSAATVAFTAQQSPDLEVWLDSTSLAPPTADSEVSGSIAFQYRWMRLKAQVSGSDPGVACWLAGELVRREGPMNGEAA